ncbi:hypothetical protein KGQ25_02505 [Patescibacteria group bacterium]|nr:hypothetical protein [Patescibacteria group bacterium]MDE2021532.1 hypothetical protein [Patescibacteria group bacterium]MDE2173286.1 hypothetical protein [Patescibacteria group bacterium]
MIEYIFAFLAGGTFTLLVTVLEIYGFPTLSRVAALFPVVTWLSYLFIGHIDGALAVSRHAHFVMLGTLVAWMPYMFIIYYFAPRIGVARAIVLGIVVFLLLAFGFAAVYNKWV